MHPDGALPGTSPAPAQGRSGSAPRGVSYGRTWARCCAAAFSCGERGRGTQGLAPPPVKARSPLRRVVCLIQMRSAPVLMQRPVRCPHHFRVRGPQAGRARLSNPPLLLLFVCSYKRLVLSHGIIQALVLSATKPPVTSPLLAVFKHRSNWRKGPRERPTNQFLIPLQKRHPK